MAVRKKQTLEPQPRKKACHDQEEAIQYRTFAGIAADTLLNPGHGPTLARCFLSANLLSR